MLSSWEAGGRLTDADSRDDDSATGSDNDQSAFLTLSAFLGQEDTTGGSQTAGPRGSHSSYHYQEFEEENDVFNLFRLSSDPSKILELRSLVQGNPAIVRSRSEANLKFKDHTLPYNSTCLHAAAFVGNSEAIEVLLLAEEMLRSRDGSSACTIENHEDDALSHREIGVECHTALVSDTGDARMHSVPTRQRTRAAPSIIGSFNSQGYTALMLAAQRGHLACVRLLSSLEAGLASPRTAEETQYPDKPKLRVEGRTALHCAAVARAYDCVLELAPREAGLFQHYWMTHRRTDRTKYIVEGLRCALDILQAQAAMTPQEPENPLYEQAVASLATERWFQAAVEGDVETLEALSEHNIGRVNPAGETALYLAVVAGTLESVRPLAAESEMPTFANDLPMALAIRKGREDITVMLRALQPLRPLQSSSGLPGNQTGTAEARGGPKAPSTNRSPLELAMELGQQGLYGVFCEQLRIL